jgi:PAS domain S-box-containing protein
VGLSAGHWNGAVCAEQLVHEVLLGEAFENAPVAAIVLDERGAYAAVNRHACELTGYERAELLAQGAAALAVNGSAAHDRLEPLTVGETAGGRSEIRRRDGSVLPISFRSARTTAAGLPFFVLIFWETGAATG